MINEYEERQEAKRERYLDRADKADAESNSRFQASHDRADMIPLGQPILVGHHSEKRHRRDIERINNDMRKSVEASDKAEYYKRKAAGVGTGGVSSDDPEAVVKLQMKLSGMEHIQRTMKAVNKIIKSKKLDDTAKVAAITDAGLTTEDRATELLKPDFCGRIGFASYQLTNNNANIRRIKERIETLKRATQAEDVHREADGYDYYECTTENRIMFEFDGKPEAEIRTTLKSWGFKWSPSRGTWVRMLNNAGRYAAKQVMEAI